MIAKNSLLFFLFLIFTILLFPHLKSEETKLCLTMIVRNEGKIIERCLESAKKQIDCISICDTGSTDDTISIIEQFMKKNGIPGKVHRHEWKNFGHNRTLSVEAAQKTLKELGFPLEKTYLLLLDADMVLEAKPEFHKADLKSDSYLIVQKNHHYSYCNTRLVLASLPWISVGVTHEYWSSPLASRQGKLETLSIDDRDDGGCKSDKFERDIKLLTQGLQEEPDNVRYMFYLAQSYKCLKQYDNAIKWYQNRINKGGWQEEIWYAKYMIGQCYEDLNDWEKALENYLDAYAFQPTRAEPLQQISSYYRHKEKYHLAYLFAKEGSEIPYPRDEILFISDPVYEYLFDQDISISAFYTPHKEEGYAATNRLMLKKGIPQYIKDQAYNNIQFYLQHLKNAQYIPIEIKLPPVRPGLASHYNPMNPSIQKTPDGFDVICRTVNYIQIGAKHFKSLDILEPSFVAKTRNFFVQYDPNFQILSQQEIIEELPRSRTKTYVEGLEDCRMFEFDDSTWFTCTTLDTNPIGMPQISLGKLSDNRFDRSIQVEKLIPLMPPNPQRCEKNWLPFIKNNEFYVIYSYDPFIIYKPILDFNMGIGLVNPHTICKNTIPQHDFSHFSGSAGPIPFKDGKLVLVHETVYTNDQRIYMHRFVYLDKDFNIEKVSKPFIFLHKGIEYCCGMTLDHSEKNLVLSIGIEDREAYLCTVDLETVIAMLEPLPKIQKL